MAKVLRGCPNLLVLIIEMLMRNLCMPAIAIIGHGHRSVCMCVYFCVECVCICVCGVCVHRGVCVC